MTKPLPWTFLTSHALVLLSIDRRRGATVRVLAESAGVTQRQVHRIIGDLAAEGWISVKRVGRQNRYTINRRKLVRDASVTGVELGELLVALND